MPQAMTSSTATIEHTTDAAALGRYRRTALAAGAASVAIYLWLQLDLLGSRVFGNFYDIQARALLDGQLAVPPGSLGNEAFAVRGQEFLYNPPGPSLLRLPIFLFTDRLDGRLTAVSMLAAYVVTVVVLCLLVWRVRGLLAPGAALSRSEALLLGTFLVAGTAGSTLLYLGSIPWVFHEAYLWAIPMTLGAAHALIGVLQRPSTAGVLAVGGFTLGAVMSRATAGFACAAAVMAAAAWLWSGRRGQGARSWWWSVLLAGAVPVVLSAAVNWAKFRHPWLFPIEDQVFTGLSEHRREAIAANGGDLFGFNLIWSTVPAYLRPDGIRFGTLFPFISLPAEPAGVYRGGVFDLTYRTGSIVPMMPLLVALSVLGGVRAFRRGAGSQAAILRFPLAGLALVPGGVLFGGYIAHRYTAEFVPLLLAAGAVGVVDLGTRLSGWVVDRRRLALAAVGVLAAFGLAANLAVAVSTQALANPGTVLADHLARQERFSGLVGGDLSDHVVASVELPEAAPADTVHIIGECQAVYVGTGEEFTPWVEAGNRPLRLRFTRSSNVPPAAEGALPLAELAGHRRTTVILEREDDRYRLAVRGGGHDDVGPWFRPPPGATFTVEVTTDRSDDYVVEAAGDGVVLEDDSEEGDRGADEDTAVRVPKEDHDADWYWQPNLLEPRAATPQALASEGVLLEVLATDPPVGCEDLLREYRETTATPP